MPRAERVIPWVAALMLLTPGSLPAATETAERTLRVEEELEPADVVTIENLLGSVEVCGGGPEGRFVVEARIESEGETVAAASDLADRVRLDLHAEAGGPRVHVAVPLDEFTAFCSPRAGKGRASAAVDWVSSLLRLGGSTVTYENQQVRIERLKGAAPLAVHLSVTLPGRGSASIAQAAGPVQVVRMPGTVRIRVQQGDILAEQIYGRVDAKTEEGEIRLRSLKGAEAVAETGRGSIELADVDVAEVSLRLGEGTVKARSVRGQIVRASVEKGPIAFDGLEGSSLDLSTGEGNLEVLTSLDRTRTAAISSGSGDVTLRLGGVTPFRLEARLGKGNLRSKLRKAAVHRSEEDHALVTRGDGGADISIRLGRGDVALLPQ